MLYAKWQEGSPKHFRERFAKPRRVAKTKTPQPAKDWGAGVKSAIILAGGNRER